MYNEESKTREMMTYKEIIENDIRKLKIEKEIESSFEEVMRDCVQFKIDAIKQNKKMIEILALFAIIKKDFISDKIQTTACEILQHIRINATETHK
jgi:hypothetical protein